MLRDRNFQLRLEAEVEALERTTSAELVVVLAPASGSYRDIELMAGAVLALVGLAVMIFLPLPVPELLALSHTALAFVGGAILCHHAPPLRRGLTPARRRRRQVEREARLAFVEEGVAATRERNGLLLYVSKLERDAEIVPDLGVDGRVARSRWNEILEPLRRGGVEGEDVLLEVVRTAGRILSEAFPPGTENPDEIPNAPRIRR